MRNRFLHLLKQAIPLLIITVSLLFLSAIGFGIPCLFHKLTGFYCPGCGATRMALALLHLDFKAAFHYNPALTISLPIIAIIIGSSTIRYLFTGKSTFMRWQNILTWILLIFTLVICVLRNLTLH